MDQPSALDDADAEARKGVGGHHRVAGGAEGGEVEAVGHGWFLPAATQADNGRRVQG
jgi:hypothetical protein